jgi:hypothetical protein
MALHGAISETNDLQSAIEQAQALALSAGAVSARRPRSGRSEAKSIDGAEPGAMMTRVMADASARPQQHSPSNITRSQLIANCGTPCCFA